MIEMYYLMIPFINLLKDNYVTIVSYLIPLCIMWVIIGSWIQFFRGKI